APVGGTIAEVNDALKDNPGLLNEDPYGAGWIAVITPDNLDGDIGALQGADGLADWVAKQYAEKKS
ncbi:MAG: glycine cleavage system protein H, partial [Candidatus Thorarchaeota archaeon]